ncbi:MAG: hypothetical protein JST90_04170 [Bacteroidetes bacterium]|nr:hypothetical protein [Bacteroidota bacterium]
MKTYRLLAAAMLVIALWHSYACAATTSSAPQGINYQSVARNSAGQILANQPVNLRISIRDSSSSGAIIYQEHHQIITNAFGTFSVVIGGGSIILGNFGSIAWGAADKYIQTDMDFAGGNNYQTLGVSKLQSIAYALYAGASAADISSVKHDTTGVLTVQTAGNSFQATKPVWMAGGNSGLSTINNWLGTIDNSDVIIKTKSVEAVRYTKGGALLATGGNTGTTPASGAGTRMEWIPAKGAFRTGTVTGTQWDDGSIGNASIAMGKDVVASGAGAIAAGYANSALGAGAVAIGTGLITKGDGTIAVGAYNDTTALAADSAGAADILFQVGSGSSNTARGNAFSVEKDGDVVAPQLNVSNTLTINPGSSSILISTVVATRDYSYMKVGSLGLPILNTVTLANGSRIGQILVVQGEGLLAGLTTAGVQILDNSTTQRLNGNASLSGGARLTVMWDGSSWVELSRSN